MSKVADIIHRQDFIGVESPWHEIKEAVKSTPTMVFSVIGDSENFVTRAWPTNVFQTALIEAAKSGGDTWILYRGLNSGVSKIISDAYLRYVNLKCSSKSGNTLIDDVERHIKLISFAGKQIKTATSKSMHSETREEVTDSFLLDFEVFVSKQNTVFSMPVPIAIIVCEGNIETIAHISEALGNNIAVIIMKGSGKAADLVSDYLDNPHVIVKKVGTLLGIDFDERMNDTLTKYLQIIDQKRHLVGIFDVKRDDPLMLSNIVGETIVSCWSMETIAEANDKFRISQQNKKVSSLTLKFLLRNNINPTKETVYQFLEDFKQLSKPYAVNETYQGPTSLPLYYYFGHLLLEEMGMIKECGPILLFEALKANRCDYVEVLLNQGVTFDIKYLPELYEQVFLCQHCAFKEDCPHLNSVLKQIKMTKRSLEKSLNGEIKGGPVTETLPAAVADSAEEVCRTLLDYKADEFKSDMSPQDKSLSNVLLWAILANRKELAAMFWLRGNDQLLTGLVCSAVLKELSVESKNIKEQILANDLKKHSKLFKQRCLHMMDEMCKENANQSSDLMATGAIVWGIFSSPLNFAHEHFLYDVLAHVCSQKNISKQWYNDLPPNLRPYLKSAVHESKLFLTAPLTKYIVNSIFFFIMVFLFSVFVLTSINKEKDDQVFVKVSIFYVYIWGIGDVAEEVISFLGGLHVRSLSYRKPFSRTKRFLQNFWNVADLLSYVFLIAGVAVRELGNDKTFNMPRRLYAFSLVLMYLRCLKVFVIHKTIGTTLSIIKEMVKDLLVFVFIAFFVILGVGIYYEANFCPDQVIYWDEEDFLVMTWNIFIFPYWQLTGEHLNDYMYGNKEKFCPNYQADLTIPVAAAFYVLFSNILLTNLVIAKFSYTFQKVQDNAEKLWSYEMYTMTNDYKWRIPSPINLIFVVPRFIYFTKLCKKTKVSEEQIDNKTKEYIRDFQRTAALKINNSK